MPPGGHVQDCSPESLRPGTSARWMGGMEVGRMTLWERAAFSGFSFNWGNSFESITFLGHKSTYSGISNLGLEDQQRSELRVNLQRWACISGGRPREDTKHTHTYVHMNAHRVYSVFFNLLHYTMKLDKTNPFTKSWKYVHIIFVNLFTNIFFLQNFTKVPFFLNTTLQTMYESIFISWNCPVFLIGLIPTPWHKGFCYRMVPPLQLSLCMWGILKPAHAHGLFQEISYYSPSIASCLLHLILLLRIKKDISVILVLVILACFNMLIFPLYLRKLFI